MSRYFVTCARGVEEVTAQELRDLGAASCEIVPGGVNFEGDQGLLYKAHLWLRTGNRIFLPLRSFPCRNPDDLYENLYKFRWETFLKEGRTFAVDCTLSGRKNPALSHSHYAKLRAKDAIVDRMREKTGARPDVDVDRPDVGVILYIRDGVCTLNMDATGRSLHERGYRASSAEAPLKETLAAAILRLAEWDPATPLIDPMCGSGTFLTEAALIATNSAPAYRRKDFLFKNWPDFYAPRWEACLREAEEGKKELSTPLFGYDRSEKALRQTRDALASLRVQATLEKRRFEDFQLPELSAGISPGLIVMNPPYGERLGEQEELAPLYRLMGDTFKQKLKGWRAAVFTGNIELGKSIGLKPKRRIPLFNGPLESRLFIFDLY